MVFESNRTAVAPVLPRQGRANAFAYEARRAQHRLNDSPSPLRGGGRGWGSAP